MGELALIINQFHLIRPWWLLCILPVMALLILLWKSKNHNSAWSNIISRKLMPYLLIQGHQQQNRLPLILLGFVWVLLIIALSGPAWKEIPQAVEKKVQARVIVMDLSLSMYSSDIQPKRYIRAKHKLSDLLKSYKEGETGLIVYSGDAHIVSPLTDDINTIQNLVPSLNPEIMPVKGSNIVAAMETAVNLLQNTAYNKGHIILITDGIQSNDISSILNIKKLDFYQLSILGVGTDQGAPITLEDGSFLKDHNNAIVIPKLDSGVLTSLAGHLQGQYVAISTDDKDINTLNKTVLGSQLDIKTKKTSQQFDSWQDNGPWLVLFCLPFISLAFRKGWLGVLSIGLLFYGSANPEYSHASVWDDLWLRKDQQGQKLFEQNKYNEAANKFKNKDWKAASLYRQGKYEEAVEEFADKEDSNQSDTALYNQGNALAKNGHFQEAIDLYEKALKINPEFEDAKFNRDLVSEILKNSSSEQNKNNQDDSSSSNSKNKEKSSSSNNQEGEQDKQNQQSQNSNGEQQKDTKQNKSETKQQSDSKQKYGDTEKNQSKNKNNQEKQQEAENSRQQTNKTGDDTSKWQENLSSDELLEQKQALEQWLRRIPDDPGDLLKRKFYLQSLHKEQKKDLDPW